MALKAWGCVIAALDNKYWGGRREGADGCGVADTIVVPTCALLTLSSNTSFAFWMVVINANVESTESSDARARPTVVVWFGGVIIAISCIK